MTAPPLPTPRALLTTLLDTLSLIPGEATSQQQQKQQLAGTYSTATPQPSPIPLRHLPPSSRPLLTTLHTLYPRLLLPALDLLDRRLVLRVLVADAGAVFYRVRSAQEPARRGRGGDVLANQAVYVVRAETWSCSCAPFAFSAFPAEAAAAAASEYTIGGADEEPDEAPDEAPVDDGNVGGGSSDEWGCEEANQQFGGRSRDGRPPSAGGVGSGDVPCCKHLLACVLAERWGVLGPYVEEYRAGPEEAVGLMTGS